MIGRSGVLLAVAVVLSGCGAQQGASAPTSAPSAQGQGSPAVRGAIGKRTKTSGCVVQGALPDRACTPGAIFSDVTTQQVCTLGYSKSVRRVSSSTRRRAYEEYGIRSHARGQYEVDHLISLELGGSNSIANLWPEAASPAPGFHQKDRVENYLHQQMCDGKISMRQAQTEIATNWLAVYHHMSH